MKPQSDAFLERSRELLEQADKMLHIGLIDAAGRTAYIAGYHAAQALLFEHHERTFKTHKGVQGEFARLVKDDVRFDIELRAFLGRTYQLKSIADYEVGSGAKVSPAEAIEAIAVARRFIGAITQLLAAEAP